MLNKNAIEQVLPALHQTHAQTDIIFTTLKASKKLRPKVLSKFKEYKPEHENVLVGAVYVFLGFITGGILITDRAIHHRLQHGYAGLPSSGCVLLSEIHHLHAEHRDWHPCHKGGNPGPAFWINHQEVGWTQLLWVMNQEDEAFLIDLFQTLNPENSRASNRGSEPGL